jgi:hypothetical protein
MAQVKQVYQTTVALPQDFANLGGRDVYSLAIDRTNPNVVYQPTYRHPGISTDGNSWKDHQRAVTI